MNRMTHASVSPARDMSASFFLIGALSDDIKADRRPFHGRPPGVRHRRIFQPQLEVFVLI